MKDENVFPDGRVRCFWVNPSNPLAVAYHDTEWGVPACDDRYLYEMLILESFQCGLSWECVLNKRQAFRKAFGFFRPEQVASYTEADVERIVSDPGIIRHRGKIRAAIRNTRIFLDISEQYGSFRAYLENFSGGGTVFESCREHTRSALSDQMARDLKNRGMSFLGTVTVYSYLQAIGMVNGHTESCFLHRIG